MIKSYTCCPGGAVVDVGSVAGGKISDVLCVRCGRWFLSHAGAVARGHGPRIPGDVYVDQDGSFHVHRSAVRDLIAELSQTQ
jgi:hypothetical protein